MNFDSSSKMFLFILCSHSLTVARLSCFSEIQCLLVTSIMSHENQRLRNIVLKQASSIAKIKPSHHAICKRLWTLSKDTGFAASALT
jgi:hypothetical protein